jgi:hypothetical protein
MALDRRKPMALIDLQRVVAQLSRSPSDEASAVAATVSFFHRHGGRYKLGSLGTIGGRVHSTYK